MLFRADFAFKSVLEITPEFLKEEDIKGLLLDLDNTLTTHDNPKPANGVIDWTSWMVTILPSTTFICSPETF